MSGFENRAQAISALAELCEDQGATDYVIGYLSSFLTTDQLESAVAGAVGFVEGRRSGFPRIKRVTDVHDPRD